MDIVDPQNISSSSLAFNATLALMSIIALFMVLRLPRLLALFGTSSEWLDGYILHHVQVRPSRRKLYIRHGPFDSPFSDSKESTSDSSHMLCHSTSYRSYRNEKLRATRMRYPPHIPACPKAIRPILKLFRARIAPGFSIGQLVILSIYFYVLCFAGFYNSNIFLDQSRTGWIAVAQLPFVFAFAQKGNFLGTFFGFGYEKVW
jgi:ferric-chelate reductase